MQIELDCKKAAQDYCHKQNANLEARSHIRNLLDDIAGMGDRLCQMRLDAVKSADRFKVMREEYEIAMARLTLARWHMLRMEKNG